MNALQQVTIDSLKPIQKESQTRFTQEEILPLKNDLGALGNRINLATTSAHNKINKMMTLKFALLLRDYRIYRQGIQMYYHVFSAIEFSLERELKNPESEWGPILEKIWHPAMARKEALYQDLMFYYGEDDSKFSIPILPETIAFAEHIKKVTAEKPYLLLAYMHVLYLALFAGGRLLRSKMAKATGLFPQVKGKTHEDIMLYGTNFLKFDKVEDEQTLRIVYKRNYELNTRNTLTETQKQEVLKEGTYVFEQNAVCIKEIESHNIQKLKAKAAYKSAVYGYYLSIFIITLIFIYYMRRVVGSFF